MDGLFFVLRCKFLLHCYIFLSIIGAMHSKTNPVTTMELRLAYRLAGLWRVGFSFESACAAPLVRWAMEKSALATRRAGNQPAQLRLI